MKKKKFLRWWPILYYVFYFLVFGLLLLSLGFELISENSFISFLLLNNLFPQWLLFFTLPPLAAPKIIIQTIGICSFFIGWIIKKLDTVEYGVKYTDILRDVWPFYKVQVIIHFVSALVGLCMIEWGCTEGAYLSCIIVILGIYPQCRVMHIFLLNRSKRQEKIQQELNDRKTFEDLLLLADQITLNNLRDFPNLLNIFIENFYDYCDKSDRIEEVAYIWERIFAQKSEMTQFAYDSKWFKCRFFETLQLFLENNKSNNGNKLVILSCGYFLFLCKNRNLSEKVLLDIYAYIGRDEMYLSHSNKAFITDLKILFSLVSMQCILSHKTSYNIEFLSTVHSINRSEINSRIENKCFRDSCDKVFDCLNLEYIGCDSTTFFKLYDMLPFKE